MAGGQCADSTRFSVSRELKLLKKEPKFADRWDQYTYDKFGGGHIGELAVRIARAENGTGQCDRFGVNTNKSIDVGRFQINSVHFKRTTLADMTDCKKNIDFAFQLYTEQGGFQAWVAYTNGNYKKINLKNYYE